jgi:hypothetical protein
MATALSLIIFFAAVAQGAVDCEQGMDTYCPANTAPIMNLPTGGGSISGVTSSCCKGSYLQCQVQQETQYRRELAFYTLPDPEGQSMGLCPIVEPTAPEGCTCQQQLRGEPFINFNFCPTPGDCCPDCECHGDP